MSLPVPLKAAPPPGGSGNPSTDAIIAQQNGINRQSSLLGTTKGGKRHSHRMKKGGAAIPVGTVTPRYAVTSAGNQTPTNQQMDGLKSINQGQVQGQDDKVPLVTTGGRKSRKSHKTKKSRKSRKSKKSKKSRKSRK